MCCPGGVALALFALLTGIGVSAVGCWLLVDRGYGLGFVVVGGTYAW